MPEPTTIPENAKKRSSAARAGFIVLVIVIIVAIVVVAFTLNSKPETKRTKFEVVDGQATSAVQVDPGIKVKQEWLNSFTEKFMKDYEDVSTGVKVIPDYTVDDCYDDAEKDCVNVWLDYTYYFDVDIEKEIKKEAAVFFADKGLTAKYYTPWTERAFQEIAEQENVTVSEVQEQEKYTKMASDLDNERYEDFLQNNIGASSISEYGALVLCAETPQQVEKIAGKQVAETLREENKLPDDTCLQGSNVLLSSFADGELNVRTWLGFYSNMDPKVVPQVEGRNYTEKQWAAKSKEYQDGDCDFTPNLINPYWLKWSGDETRCAG